MTDRKPVINTHKPAVDPEITDLVDKAVADVRLTRSEAACLFALGEYSPEAYYLHWGAHQIASRASHGQALIYAQLGIDANPCPGNCGYCSFAASTHAWEQDTELPLETVLKYCRAFDTNGVHLISLMTTAAYDFTRFLDIVSAVRAIIGPRTALMANIGDFDAEQAKELREAGIDVVYHAVRLREGIITAIPEKRRRETIAAVLETGFTLMSGVEPVYAELDDDEILDRMMEVSSWPLICSGLSPLRLVPGTPMANTKLLTTPRYRLLGSLFRLLAGSHIPFGSENTCWCNGGTNPRDRQMFPGDEQIAHDVAAQRQELEENGWLVPEFIPPYASAYTVLTAPPST
ncbi:MAG: radical SAM protein [Coriobacteriales bacterium]|jgi:biotin synthase|nr:radical SAM protein [Coriobacteriales bacterium]